MRRTLERRRTPIHVHYGFESTRDLTSDLRLANDQRVEPRRDPTQVADNILVAVLIRVGR
jgi:hypothetical protein